MHNSILGSILEYNVNTMALPSNSISFMVLFCKGGTVRNKKWYSCGIHNSCTMTYTVHGIIII